MNKLDDERAAYLHGTSFLCDGVLAVRSNNCSGPLSAEARPTDGFERNPRREITAARTERACVQSTDWSAAAAGFSGPWSSGVDNKKHASTRDYSLAVEVAQLGRSAGNPAPTRTGKIFVRGIDFSLSRV